MTRNGLDDNTLVFFTSDNGGANYIGLPDINRPYRGWKMTFFEGGMHSPFFVRWPAALPPGTTFAAPVGARRHLRHRRGRGRRSPARRSARSTASICCRSCAATPPAIRTSALFWRSGGYRTVLADGWKLQVAERPDRDWLFHLDDDPTERRDLSGEASRQGARAASAARRARRGDGAAGVALADRGRDRRSIIRSACRSGADDEYVYWEN